MQKSGFSALSAGFGRVFVPEIRTITATKRVFVPEIRALTATKTVFVPEIRVIVAEIRAPTAAKRVFAGTIRAPTAEIAAPGSVQRRFTPAAKTPNPHRTARAKFSGWRNQPKKRYPGPAAEPIRPESIHLYDYGLSGVHWGMSKPYNIFLSWSGEHAKQIALLLKEWLPNVCREAHCFMSEEDIEKGATWSLEIDDKLAGLQTAIVILTPHSVNSHWVLYEAGALSKGLTKNAVCTLICGLTARVPPPLGKFQDTRIEKEDFFKLVKLIDQRTGAQTEPTRLTKWYNQEWTDFYSKITEIIKSIGPVNPQRRVSEEIMMLEEIVNFVRRYDKSISSVLDDPHNFDTFRPFMAQKKHQISGPLHFRVILPNHVKASLDSMNINMDFVRSQLAKYITTVHKTDGEVSIPLVGDVWALIYLSTHADRIDCAIIELQKSTIDGPNESL